MMMIRAKELAKQKWISCRQSVGRLDVHSTDWKSFISLAPALAVSVWVWPASFPHHINHSRCLSVAFYLFKIHTITPQNPSLEKKRNRAWFSKKFHKYLRISLFSVHLFLSFCCCCCSYSSLICSFSLDLPFQVCLYTPQLPPPLLCYECVELEKSNQNVNFSPSEIFFRNHEQQFRKRIVI